MPSQQSLGEFVGAMDEAGFLKRINDEIRVDQIPGILEEHPAKAVLMEKIKDCEFSVLANAYSNQDMYAWAMECDKPQTGRNLRLHLC
jgi:2,5-furandicarboxylate decarboxylase 1